MTALIIIFQPELRKALEQLGSKNIITDLFISENSRQQEGYTEKTVNEITRAAFEMGKVKTGALIVIERDTPLPEIERTGIPVDGIVTSQLLINIFEHNTPLHDGAIIIRGNRVTSATCYLPLSDNLSISKDLGNKTPCALGISESTDSLTVVVSERLGRVVPGGRAEVSEGSNSPEELKLAIAAKPEEETVSGPFKLLKDGIKMKEKQNRRWGLLLISFLCAFLVWLGVVNVADPVMTNTVEVPVEIINSDVLTKNNLTYAVVGKSTTTVQYEVKTTNAYRIRSSDFRAYADMTDMWSVTARSRSRSRS